MDESFYSMDFENDSETEFTLAEIMEMESIYKGMGGKSHDQQFCEELASKFSSSVHRRGKSTIKWQQVQSWFRDTKGDLAIKISSLQRQPAEVAAKSAVESSFSFKHKALGFPLPRKVQKPAAEVPRKPLGKRIAELSDLVFEAKSFKDFAWYDVASFINYRTTNSAELEVRVRFAGFGKDQDEWVNIKRVRPRSIPLEPSECDKIKVDDLVLCFREDQYHAIYCDAYVEEIESVPHNNEVCKCTFLVRYDFDDFMEKVHLKRLCIRPT